MVLVESLEQLAGLAVAKVILALICAGSFKVDVDPRKVAGFEIILMSHVASLTV